MSTLNILSRVCRVWNDASQHPKLWKEVRFSYSKRTASGFIWCCKNRMSATKKLSITGWPVLKESDAKLLASKCSGLEHLDISGCGKCSYQTVTILFEGLKNITSLYMNNVFIQMVAKKSMMIVLENIGQSLKVIHLSSNCLSNSDAVFRCIMENCPLLEDLDISRCLFGSYMLSIPMDQFQMFCPKLKKLNLTQSLVRCRLPDQYGTGFPDLVELHLARSVDGRINLFRYITDEVLMSFAHKSEKLKILDIRACRHISISCLTILPCLQLESVSFAQCQIVNDPSFLPCLLKWSSSLQHLDLSGTAIEPEAIRKIIEECLQLKSLDLNGCRGLPLYLRMIYEADSFSWLLQKLFP